jgi:hypothetical protein
MQIVLVAVVLITGLYLEGAATLFTICGAHAVGHQVSNELAYFNVFVVLVVTTAKWFAVGCAALDRSLLIRCAGCLIAIACSLVRGLASWVYILDVTTPHVHPLFGWDPYTHHAIHGACFATAMELGLFAIVVVTPIFWPEVRVRGTVRSVRATA